MIKKCFALRHIAEILIIVLTWACVFVTSLKTPLICDDNTYVLEFDHGPERGKGFRGENCDFTTPMAKAANLFSILQYHYTHENGRFAPAVPMRLFAGLPRCYYAVMNASMFIAFIWFLFALSHCHLRWLAPISCLTVFLLLKSDAIFWMAATINYLWTIVLVMLCALIFQRADKWRLINLVWCVPLAIVSSGGHEIISVPICLALAAYWLRRLIFERHLTCNVQFWMTIAFVLGTAVIFMSPVSPLYRVGYECASSWSYLVLCKLMTIAFVFVGSPSLIIVLALLIVAILRRDGLRTIIVSNWFLLLLLAIGMLFTIMFGNLGARASWPLNVLSLIVMLRILPKFAKGVKNRSKLIAGGVCMFLGMTVLVNTAVSAVLNGNAYEKSFLQYKNNSDCVYVIPQRADWLFGFLFDRTHDPRSIVQIAHGEVCTNGNFARRLDRPCAIGLFEEDYKWLKTISESIDIVYKTQDGKWFGDNRHDFLLQELEADSRVDLYSPWLGVICYSSAPEFTLDLFVHILAEEAHRNFGGLGVFRTQVFFEHFARDLIYATLYKESPLKGFYLKNADRVFKVLVHNRFAYRDSVVGVK